VAKSSTRHVAEYERIIKNKEDELNSILDKNLDVLD
jgi:hypothetical protein